MYFDFSSVFSTRNVVGVEESLNSCWVLEGVFVFVSEEEEG